MTGMHFQMKWFQLKLLISLNLDWKFPGVKKIPNIILLDSMDRFYLHVLQSKINIGISPWNHVTVTRHNTYFLYKINILHTFVLYCNYVNIVHIKTVYRLTSPTGL